MEGFRTIFAGFHHFPAELGIRILADAVAKGQGIAIFEAQARTVASTLQVLFAAPMLLLLGTPFLQPFELRRLLLTYVVPVVPACVAFDGTVSCLRTWTDEELLAMVRRVPNSARFNWRVGRRGPVRYLIGTPAAKARL